MATHSSVLAWRIPGTGEPGGLLYVSLGLTESDTTEATQQQQQQQSLCDLEYILIKQLARMRALVFFFLTLILLGRDSAFINMHENYKVV